MIANETHIVKTSTIKVDPDRQRKEISQSEIEDLAGSIERRGLLHPIILTRDHVLVVGERRLRSWQHLEKMPSDIFSHEGIPARYTDELDELELYAIELEENLHRSDLSWQDESTAFLKFYENRVVQATAGWDNDGEAWEYSWARMSGELNVSDRQCRRLVTVGRALQSGDEAVAGCQSARAAAALLDRRTKRVVENELVTFGEVESSVPDLTALDLDLGDELALDTPTAPKEQSYLIEKADFRQWIDSYEGPRFNFVNCDFPYGINLHQSDLYDTSAREMSYEDSAELYEELCTTLSYATESVLSKSCHILFWFPMAKYQSTLRYFESQGFWVEPYPLIWGKSDKVGLTPDPVRGPRRIYETAFIMSLGDRNIVQSVPNLVWATSDSRNKLHPSQKSQPMLEDFLRMFIDSDSYVLDPTCGSGTALAASISLGAKFVHGLDINEDSTEFATDNCRNETIKLERN